MALTFDQRMNDFQTAWRRRHVSTWEHGTQNGRRYPWIVQREDWELGLWPGIRSGTEHALNDYLKASRIQKHQGVHNLKSSWTLCANLYFPHRRDPRILAAFLADRIDRRIVKVDRLELEWAEDFPLDPTTLLGEPKGRRGANQTSPDIAFVVGLADGGTGLILTENKFVEHSFYPCSGRKKENRNPDASRCLNAKSVLDDLDTQCHLLNWKTSRRKNRRYWEYLAVSDAGRRELRYCPAAVAGYQLFRQQALANAIAASGRYDLVVSTVAYDDRNDKLVRSMRTTGIDNFAKDWEHFFECRARFASFTHQQWVRWVADNDPGQWLGWLQWVSERYGYSLTQTHALAPHLGCHTANSPVPSP